jgi:hypothetical protein
VSLAAWLWPVLLLRFIRQSHAVTGPLLSLAFLSPASYFAVRDMWPLPLALIWRKDNVSPLLAKFVADVRQLPEVEAFANRQK